MKSAKPESWPSDLQLEPYQGLTISNEAHYTQLLDIMGQARMKPYPFRWNVPIRCPACAVDKDAMWFLPPLRLVPDNILHSTKHTWIYCRMIQAQQSRVQQLEGQVLGLVSEVSVLVAARQAAEQLAREKNTELENNSSEPARDRTVASE